MQIYPPTAEHIFHRANLCIVAKHREDSAAPITVSRVTDASPGYVEHEAPRVGPTQKKTLKTICTPKSLSDDGVPIQKIRIPKGWIQFERSARWASSYGYKYGFKPSNDSQVALCIYWNGTPIAEERKAAWLDILRNSLTT